MNIPKRFFAAASVASRAMREAGIAEDLEIGILIALSGGADSVYLLHTLLALSRLRPLRLEAMHVEHGIRGRESLDDAAFCESLCLSLGIPFSVVSVDVPGEAERSGQGIEETARRLRYEALRAKRSERGLDYIAVAHNETDQAETVLYHLLRGSGARGLSGMRVLSDGILRPLLSISSEQIRSVLNEEGIAFRVDSTNRDTAYTRNYLRECVFPSLARICPDPSAAIARAASLIERDLSALDRMADVFFADESKEKPIFREVFPETPLSTSSKMTVGNPSCVAITILMASIMRDISPPEALLAIGT